MTVITNQTFGEERALYGTHDIVLRHCSFDGPADGESAVKECARITMEHGFCNLRYPFWHVHELTISDTAMTPFCRAALWYSDHITIISSALHGIKALRECAEVVLRNCDIDSPECGWSIRGITMENCTAQSTYFMMRSERLRFSHVTLTGKYSFQYISDATFDHCTLDTKDAFWHAHKVTVRDSVIKGEYLAWYSDEVTFERCRIIGTQPFCYCKHLTLIDCVMVDTDLCFEKSDVNATLTAPIISIKNPLSGRIRVPAVKDIIRDDPQSQGVIITDENA